MSQRFVVTSISSVTTNGQNSLQEIYTQTDLSVAYVQENNRFYRWVAASTATPNGVSVVIPRFVPVATPGRWLLEGPPGPGQIPPGFANILCNAGIGQPLVSYEMNLDGGAPSESKTFPTPVYTGVLFEPETAVAVLDIATSNPLVQGRARIVAGNNVEACVTLIGGGNLTALLVKVWVLRTAWPTETHI